MAACFIRSLWMTERRRAIVKSERAGLHPCDVGIVSHAVSVGRPWPADGQSTCLHCVPCGQVPTCWHQLSLLGVHASDSNQIDL